ncbi:MAG: nucleotidyltransferase family protein [Clostridia bacterium]|nr:nucleotidyltransferase family protein [Clostridia bacterium]
MKIAGIIAEYNPFHAGHLYHIQKTREETGCDYVIAVMSGAFTQRGECAFIDKFARAEAALLSGVDAVFELPCVCAVRPADGFARGGVSVLTMAGADVISFGSETDDLEKLMRISALLTKEPAALASTIREGLSAGKTLARARGEALSAYLGISNEEFNQPNTALALEYLSAIKRLQSPLKPHVVKRSAPYHASVLSSGLSASEIRAAVYEGRSDEALRLLPEGSGEIMRRELEKGVSKKGALDAVALYALRSLPSLSFSDAGEGLKERILNEAKNACSYENLIERVKCKRYTRARITRAIASALIALPEKAPLEAPYLRLLGFRRGQEVLISEISRRSAGKMIANPALLESNEAFQAERRATDLWGLTVQNEKYRVSGRERTGKFIVV